MKEILSALIFTLSFFLLIVHAFSSNAAVKAVQGSTPMVTSSINVAEQRCIRPKQADVDYCQELEQQILAATARIYIRSWSSSPSREGMEVDKEIAHATVMDGRYLVTHNHFETPLSLLMDMPPQDVTTSLTITDWQGKELFSAPLTDFFIPFAGEEVLLLGLKNLEDLRWLETLGFRSSDIAKLHQSSLAPGMEVAQVDWDGEHTRIDWTVVQEVGSAGNMKTVDLVDTARSGASGGGVFSNGVHIANNWTVTILRDTSYTIIGIRSSAVLNTKELLAVQ